MHHPFKDTRVILFSGIPIELPNPWEPHKIWIILAFVGLLIFAFVIEGVRRRRQRTARIRAEWHALRELAEQRGLSAGQVKMLEELAGRYAPAHPLRAGTLYREFDACVASEMEALRLAADQETFEALGRRLRDLRQGLDLHFVPYGFPIRSTRDLGETQDVWAASKEEETPAWRKMRVSEVTEALFRCSVREQDPPPAFVPGEDVQFRLWREEDARYTFDTRLLRVENGARQWVFAHTGELKRIQSRAHFRVHFDQAATVAIIEAPADGNYEDADRFPVVARVRGRITSLSGGGIAGLFEDPLPARVLLGLDLELPGAGAVPVLVRIVHTAPLARGRYLVRGAFVNLSEENQDAISRYTLLKQQALASKEAEEGARR